MVSSSTASGSLPQSGRRLQPFRMARAIMRVSFWGRALGWRDPKCWRGQERDLRLNGRQLLRLEREWAEFGRWFGGVGDSGGVVGVDLGKGAEEQAIDVGENGGAARGDVVHGEKLVQIAHAVVDSLGGLEALGIAYEGGRRRWRFSFCFSTARWYEHRREVWSEAKRRHWRPEEV